MKKTYITLYKAKWCGYCTSFLPDWNRITAIFENNDIIKKLHDNNLKYFFKIYDDTENNDVIKNANITSFPTIKISILDTDNNTKKEFELEPQDREPNRFISALIKNEDLKKIILDKYNESNIQSGGENNTNYYLKYIKYKTKYLKIKNNL